MNLIDVSKLRRKAPTDPLTIYLDQATISELAFRPEHREALRFLQEATAHNRCTFIQAHTHTIESSLVMDRERWNKLEEATWSLTRGVHARPLFDILWNEIWTAASHFQGEEPRLKLWEEAFGEDPYSRPRQGSATYSGSIPELRFQVLPSDLERNEARKAKDIALRLQPGIEAHRSAGDTFDAMVQSYISALIAWRLAPLVSPASFHAEVTRLHGAWLGDPMLPPSEAQFAAFDKLQTLLRTLQLAEGLVSRFPALRDSARRAAFLSSVQLRHVPHIAYPALFLAAFAADGRRKADQNDLLDVDHLVVGLSRCDIVTADRSMLALCKNFKLVPDRCQLIHATDIETLTSLIA